MSFVPVKVLTVFYEPREGNLIEVGRLGRTDAREIVFEYAPGFLVRGLEISPVRLPLRPGVTVGDPERFDGLMGVFDDSLPDGWGRLLIDRRAAKAGIPAAALSPLDRLALIGARAMGALVYRPEVELEPPTIVNLPEIAADVAAVLRDANTPALDKLIALGGSPQGARPKVLVQVGDDGTVVYGDRASRPGCTPYIVKFRARDDDTHSGTLEHAYMQMAAGAGIDVPRTVMLGRSARHPGYFAVQRFDREGKKKFHMHTLAGLLHAPHSYASLTYRDLLLTTRGLTRNEAAVSEMFRRACFNVFAHNRDDHTRNFAFLMNHQGKWRPSPAYDLTFSAGPGGEHTLLVGREGANPKRSDLLELAQSADVREPQSIIEQVQAAVRDFPRYADAARLPRKIVNAVAKKLEVAAASRRKSTRHRR